MLTKAALIDRLRHSGLGFDLLESGSRWMLIAPALGARIMGAGIDEENAFWVSPDLARGPWDEGGNAGGMRTWLAPESGPRAFFFSPDGLEWGVPSELDPGNYEAISGLSGWRSYSTQLVATAADGGCYPISITRSMRLAGKAPTRPSTLVFDFRHEFKNLGTSIIEGRIGLWSILQLPCEEPGTVFFALSSLQREGDSCLRPYFVELPPGVAGVAEDCAWLKVCGGSRYKVGLAAKDSEGTVVHIRRSSAAESNRNSYLIVAMRFAVDPDGVYLDKSSHIGTEALMNGDAVQAYNDPGKGDRAFCEIEAHSSAARLAPGESDISEIEVTVARLKRNELSEYVSERLGMHDLPLSALPD
ncbi:MAG: DUF6786 family protein [Rectinemataceae bacterium]